MARLTSIKPRLKPIGSRLKAAPLPDRAAQERERFRERDKVQLWRKWYGSRRWKELRKAVWLRDAYICQKTGLICSGRYPDGRSPVADHIVPHHGDEALFWDINNIQTVSKEYHDSEKQSGERRLWG